MSTKSDVTRQRIVEKAITLFAEFEKPEVSLAQIAREAGITSQAIYRYFSNKDELYLESVRTDVDAFYLDLLRNIAPLAAPFFSGSVWAFLLEQIPHHPLAVRAILSRDSDLLTELKALEGTQLLLQAFEAEMLVAAEESFIRQDIDPRALANAAGNNLVDISIPLVLEGKLNSPEWFSLQMILLAAAFYPLPNFQDDSVVKDFQERAHRLGINPILKSYKFD